MTTFTLQSDRLTVEIAQPGTLYRRTRFDWNGFITQIMLDGKHTFCGIEDPDPAKGSGGIGLCCEFGNEKAIGYDEAAPGQTFPKPGVGLLVRRSVEPYNFFEDLEIAEAFPVQVETSADTATFTVSPLPCQGYAFQETRTIRVQGAQLEMTCRFDNLGEKAIHTHEYCHNFLSLDSDPTSSDYTLTFASPVKFENLMPLYRNMLRPWTRSIMPDFLLKRIIQRVIDIDTLTPKGSTLTWACTPSLPFFARLVNFSRTDNPQWVLDHKTNGLSVSETDDFDPARVVVWGTGQVISAEVYVDIDLEPGESKTWSRKYQFTASQG